MEMDSQEGHGARSDRRWRGDMRQALHAGSRENHERLGYPSNFNLDLWTLLCSHFENNMLTFPSLAECTLPEREFVSQQTHGSLALLHSELTSDLVFPSSPFLPSPSSLLSPRRVGLTRTTSLLRPSLPKVATLVVQDHPGGSL